MDIILLAALDTIPVDYQDQTFNIVDQIPMLENKYLKLPQLSNFI